MSYQEPGSGNVFIPTHEATAYMVSGYSRNINSFRSLHWQEIRPVTKTKGFFLRWKSEQAARDRYGDMREWVWPDQNDRPNGQDNLESFEFEQFKTTRYAPTYTIGKRTLDQADWPLEEAQTKLIGHQMMTGRASIAVATLTAATTNNLWEGNEANVDGSDGALNGNAALLTSGQNWGNGTATVKNIQNSIFQAVIAINKATLGVISFNDLVLVLSPDTARRMAISAEVSGVMSNSVFAATQLENGGIGNPNQEFGLPPKLGGVRVIVDDTVQITSRKGAATLTNQYILPTGEAYLLTRRPEEMVGKNSQVSLDDNGNENEDFFPVYSTVVGFYYEEMTIEAMADPWNRKVSASVVSDFDNQVSSFKGAFHFGNVFSD